MVLGERLGVVEAIKEDVAVIKKAVVPPSSGGGRVVNRLKKV
jgi:hypothetical protein